MSGIVDVPKELVDSVFEMQESPKPTPEELRKAAVNFLLTNQECYVAQWILQNPFADISQYKLKFQYNDESYMGYSVIMEKTDV